MSGYPQQQPQAIHTTVVVQQQSNGWGTAGFVCSLLGLVFCGFLGPVGFVLSLIGMTKEPKGLAIAGLILSLVDVAIIAFMFLAGFTMLAGCIGITSEAMDAATYREWTLQDGTSFEAQFKRVNGEEVILLTRDKERLVYDLEDFCEADQQYIEIFRQPEPVDEGSPFIEEESPFSDLPDIDVPATDPPDNPVPPVDESSVPADEAQKLATPFPNIKFASRSLRDDDEGLRFVYYSDNSLTRPDAEKFFEAMKEFIDNAAIDTELVKAIILDSSDDQNLASLTISYVDSKLQNQSVDWSKHLDMEGLATSESEERYNVLYKPRTWQDSTGKHSIHATFGGIAGDTVTLIRVGNKEKVRLLLEKLSEADRRFIDDELVYRKENKPLP